jgi:hypothetical protein
MEGNNKRRKSINIMSRVNEEDDEEEDEAGDSYVFTS